MKHNSSRLRALLHWVLERRGVHVHELGTLLDVNDTYIHRWLVSADWKTHPYTKALESVFGWDWDKVMDKYSNILGFADLHPRGYVSVVMGFWREVRACPLSLETTIYRHCVASQVHLEIFASNAGISTGQLTKIMDGRSAFTQLMYERFCRKSPEFTRFHPLPFRCHNPEHRALLQLALHKEWVTSRGLTYRYDDARRDKIKDPIEHIASTYRHTAQHLYPEYWQLYIGDPKPLTADKVALGSQLREYLRGVPKTLLDAANR